MIDSTTGSAGGGATAGQSNGFQSVGRASRPPLCSGAGVSPATRRRLTTTAAGCIIVVLTGCQGIDSVRPVYGPRGIAVGPADEQTLAQASAAEQARQRAQIAITEAEPE